jgi:hypothetical protein
LDFLSVIVTKQEWNNILMSDNEYL